MKRALPEIDRLSRNEKAKADLNSVDKVIHEVGRLGEVLSRAVAVLRLGVLAREQDQLGHVFLEALGVELRGGKSSSVVSRHVRG